MAQLLGKLEKVDIRKIWEHEALSFTPWLAMPENLSQLGEALGIEFDEDNIQKEVGVGDFSADILTSDLSGRKVVIENQLEKTDHDHLGKCITYAAGVGAEIIIWIARNVRDEHKQAVEYLNQNSSDKLNIFLVQLEAYKIGDSKPAPHFTVIESPNEWTKVVRGQNNSSSNVSEVKLKQQSFFEMVRDYGMEHSKKVPSWQKPQPQHWYTIRSGSSVAHFNILTNSREACTFIEVYIDGGKDSEAENRRIYDRIYQDKDKIESEIGELIWNDNEENRSKMIRYRIDKDPMDDQQAQESLPLVIEKLDQFISIFPKYWKKK